MHKDKKLMAKLPCGIYRITSHNYIEKLKEPRLASSTKSLAERPDNVTYREMMPGWAEEELSLSEYFLLQYTYIYNIDTHGEEVETLCSNICIFGELKTNISFFSFF